MTTWELFLLGFNFPVLVLEHNLDLLSMDEVRPLLSYPSIAIEDDNEEDETIDTFTTKLTTLVNKAASLGHTMEDETLVSKPLNAIPDRIAAPGTARPEDRIVDFPEGKVGVYMKFFEFANLRLPLSQFLFDILGYYQIHLLQLSVIGTAKQEARENTPQCYAKPLDSLKNWNNRFFWVDERVFPTIVDWRTSAPKDGMPAENTYSPEAVMILNTHRTRIQKQPKALLCLVGLTRRYYLGDEVYPTFLYDDDRDMDLFYLIRAPNPTKVKTGSRPRVAHKVPLLTVTANQVIEMEDPATATDSSRNVTTTGVALEANQAERVVAMGPPVVKERRKRGHDGVDTNAPPKVLRRDHADPRPTESTHRGKSLAAIELGMGFTRPVPAS
uniref:Transposase (Putative), gypsy type n=1 Tax=Tanacetum cinerariifolium TaxID=118510 RepID=A0A6L2JIT4_TANCI|nr:transposase (putative), gypsy type [Tanacetum cinerariifolium]